MIIGHSSEIPKLLNCLMPKIMIATDIFMQGCREMGTRPVGGDRCIYEILYSGYGANLNQLAERNLDC